MSWKCGIKFQKHVIWPKLEEPLDLKFSTFKLFVNYSNYSNSWVRIALFGIHIRSFFRNRIYSVFDAFSKSEYIRYSVFGQILLFVTTLDCTFSKRCGPIAERRLWPAVDVGLIS